MFFSMKICHFLHFCPSLQKYVHYSFDCAENLHAYVKSKIKWGNCQELFSIFFIENELFKENLKQASAVKNRMVELFSLHHWFLYQYRCAVIHFEFLHRMRAICIHLILYNFIGEWSWTFRHEALFLFKRSISLGDKIFYVE